MSTYSLSDSDRKAFEAYLLSTTEDEKIESIKKLIPGSELYYHLYLLDRLKKVGANLTQEDQEILQQFKIKFPYSNLLKKIEIRLSFLQYDEATSEDQKQTLLTKISGYLPFGEIHANYVKPEDMRRQDDQDSSHSEDESSSQQNADLLGFNFGAGNYISAAPSKKEHKLNYDKYFGKDIIWQKFKDGSNDLYASQDLLNQLPHGFEHDLDFNKYNLESVYNWANSAGYRISDLQNDTFYEALGSHFLIKFASDRYFTLNPKLCDNLSLIQLDRLATLHPSVKSDKTFIGSYFQKQFHEELSKENQELWSSDEKRANLLTLYNYTKSKDMPLSLQSSLLIEILQLGVKLNIYDEVLFRDFLSKPLHTQANVWKQNKVAYVDTHWNRYIGNVQSQQNNQGATNESQNEMIKQYLEHFCQEKGGSLETFKEDFDVNYLKQIEERIAIYNSDDLTNLSIDIRKYQTISQEVIVRFLESNQEQFKVDEEVKLSLELKNIQTLYVKIFEFNTETYYKKTLQPFNTGVNLDGLIASIEKNFEYKNPSNKKFIESFSFPELTGKVGLFIVEFIGNGMSSRAVIKKGSLSLIHKPTIAGHLAYVLDENKKICSGPKTGIYFDGQYYESQTENNGKIFIPYGKVSLLSKAILINNGFAQLSDFERLYENYQFSAWIYVNPESILIGNKASVLIKPQLLINGRQASVEILKKTKITLTTLNYVDSIPVTKNFENVKFINNQELLLDFQVPPYLSNISVSIDTEVFNITNQMNQKFAASRVFQVDTNNNTMNMNELFLRKQQGEYFIYLLGKNGEPKKNVNLQINLMHNELLKQSNRSTDVTLNTDKDGKVKLGHLKKIIGMQVKCELFGLTKNFMLRLQSQDFTYPSSVDAIENENLEFPVSFNNKTRKNISLLRLNQERIVLEDLFDKVEFARQEGIDYNKIYLNNLPDGQYILNIKNIKKNIEITIHKGQNWETDTFILKNNCLFENRAPTKMIKISKINSIIIYLNFITQLRRAKMIRRILVFNYKILVGKQEFMYTPPNLNLLFHLKWNTQSKTVFPFAQWKNIFMSNRELSDEFRYVFDRKYAERFQGNTLERPRLVLKRTFIQATQINHEVLRQGTQFQQQAVQEIQQFSQNIAPRSFDRMPQQYQQQQQIQRSSYSSFSSPGDEMGYDQMIEALSASETSGQIKIPEFQNFLKNSPLALFNMYPNSDGVVNFSANLSNHTQLFIVAIDQQSVSQRQIDLDVNPIQKRDLSLNKPLDSDKGFTESRTTNNIYKHETHFIEDITSTEIQLIDDLKKVKGVLEELMKTHGTQNSGSYKALNELLLKWPGMKKEDKNKQYSKNFCHELNIYIYFKDQEYFQEIVKSYLQNKMEKTFIDNYLLGNYEKLLKYSSIDGLKQINAFEQCLLVDALIKKANYYDAKRIVNYLELERDTNELNEVNTNNKVFDTVLNLNMLKVQDFTQDPFGDIPAANLNMDVLGFAAAAQTFDMSNQPPPPNFAPFANYANMNQIGLAHPMMNQNADFGGFGGGGYGGGMVGGVFGATTTTLSAPMRNSAPRMQMMQQPVQSRAMALNRVAPASYQINQEQDLFDDMSYSNANYNEDIFLSANNYVPEYQQQKQKARMQFEEVQTTNEFMETHYYKQTQYHVSSSNIQVNSFWVDYANYILYQTNGQDSSQRQFLTSNFIKNANNSISALLSFALLDLPYDAESHGYKTNEGRGVEIKACGNIILFKKEVREAPLEISNDILVTHRYSLADQQNTTSSAIPDEFLTNKAYTCEVIMTNVSPQHKDFSILYQIPQGSLPLEMTKYMKSIPKSLASYSTNRLFFYFYFPHEGSFIHFPSNISQDQKIIARASPVNLKVVDKLSVNKKETFQDIVQGGNRDDIIEFMQKHNLNKGEKGFEYRFIMWMLQEKDFFLRVVKVLRERYMYNEQIWAFGFRHSDEETIREYLQMKKNNNITSTYIGLVFQSKLLTITEEERELKHLDYYPFINSRAHSVGETEQWTLNKTFKDSYEKFLQHMVEVKEISIKHKMMFIYNLQLQDRISEAINLFSTIDITKEEAENSLRIQYDYMSAYFDFFTGHNEGFKTARSIVRKYEDYPLPQWRLLFLEILDQLNEFDGEAEELPEIDEDNMTDEQKKIKMKQSIKKEPRLECEVSSEKQTMTIEVANIKGISIKFYIIDAEILFSRTPFVKENTEEFSYVKPTSVIERELNNADLNSSIDTVTYLQTTQKFEIDIPENLKNQNMVIEVTGEGKQLFRTYYSTQIKVNILESYGELKVTDNQGVALPKVYVKVFAQKIGGSTASPFFFKDGYTDIRGKFEYAQTSGNRLKEVQKFAIFVMSDTLGSIIKECNPPKVDQSSVASVEEETQNQRKEQRIISKVAQHKAKYSK